MWPAQQKQGTPCISKNHDTQDFLWLCSDQSLQWLVIQLIGYSSKCMQYNIMLNVEMLLLCASYRCNFGHCQLCCNSSLSIFMSNKIPSGMIKRCENTEPESVSFFSSCFRQASLKLHEYIRGVSQNNSFYTEQCTTPSLFQILWGAFNHPLKNYGFVWDAIKV